MKVFYKILGYVVVILWMALNVYLFIVIDSNSISVNDTFSGFGPLFLQNTFCIALVLWVNSLLLNDSWKYTKPVKKSIKKESKI